MLLMLFLMVVTKDQMNPPVLIGELAGVWQVAYVLHPGPMGKGGSGEGEMTASKGPGASILMDFRCTTGPMQGFTLVQLIVWNKITEQFETVWADAFSPGMGGVKYGKVDGNKVTYAYKTKMGEQLLHHKSVVTYFNKDHFQAESDMSRDGRTYKPSMKLTYRRASIE